MKIGWIGTGVMGNPMCGHLLKHGHTVMVYSRTKAKLDNLLSERCYYAQPVEIAKSCDVVFTMLGFPKDLEDMVLDANTGILSHMKPGSIFIDHTTSSPNLAVAIYNKAKELGVDAIDAPVSGGDVGAMNGQLVVMCGSNLDAYQRAKPLLSCYSKAIELFGGAGMGQHAKMANQISVASTVLGTCETMLYASRVGLKGDQLINLIKNGAAASFSLEKYGPRILERNLDPGFYIEHFVKDLEICVQECWKMNLTLPGLENARMLFKLCVAQGKGKLGVHGLTECLEHINNIETKSNK